MEKRLQKFKRISSPWREINSGSIANPPTTPSTSTAPTAPPVPTAPTTLVAPAPAAPTAQPKFTEAVYNIVETRYEKFKRMSLPWRATPPTAPPPPSAPALTVPITLVAPAPTAPTALVAPDPIPYDLDRYIIRDLGYMPLGAES